MNKSDKPQLRQITREDIEFLADLQNEMNTQPHLCQADPRFWVVKTFEYREAASDDHIDRVTFYDDEGDISSMSFERALGGFAHAKSAMHRAKSERRKRKRLGTGTEGMARNDLHRWNARIGENDTAA